MTIWNIILFSTQFLCVMLPMEVIFNFTLDNPVAYPGILF